ncbi:hypothetical protein CSA37_02995 [Candidatus Fermentibacteria bacterium]|nr:MAG: hypothetical protein CSA37_02995 [Candidatus Fermentibacteria bacterium]
MKKMIAFIATVSVLTLIAGCGSGNVPVKIINDLGAWNIEEVQIDPTDSPWGENRITEPIVPGENETISVPAGSYDMRITDEDGDTYTRWDVEIGAEGYQWSVTLDDID